MTSGKRAPSTGTRMPRTGWRSPAVLWALGSGLALAIIVVVVAVVSLGMRPDAAPDDAAAPPPPEPSPTAEPADCDSPTVTVENAMELGDALGAPTPGTVIQLADGVYQGNFVATGDGTADDPIVLCGGSGAVLDGGEVGDGYVLHLDRASHWVLQGFTVQNGQKGVMVDGTTESVIRDLTVTTIGDEAIHLRKFSTDNSVIGNQIRDTGLRKEKFGEGIYIGTAESNWCDISACEPDRSDRNTISGNDIAATTSESIDIKEGTSGGVLSDNTFDGSSITGADSWVDVKGNGWVIDGNTGTDSPGDGFQTHEILDGWGTNNVFRNNTATLNGPGMGYSLTPERANVVECNNTSDTADTLSNVTCSAA